MLKLPSVLKADLRAAMNVPRRPRDIREGVGRRGNVRSKGANGLRRLLLLPASAVPAGYSRLERSIKWFVVVRQKAERTVRATRPEGVAGRAGRRAIAMEGQRNSSRASSGGARLHELT